MTFPIAVLPRSAQHRAPRAWKTALSASSEAQRSPPFPTPTNGALTGLTPPAQRKGVENGELRYGAVGARFARRFPHPPNAAPKTAIAAQPRQRFPLFPQQGDTKCSKTSLTNRTPYEPGRTEELATTASEPSRAISFSDSSREPLWGERAGRRNLAHRRHTVSSFILGRLSVQREEGIVRHTTFTDAVLDGVV